MRLEQAAQLHTLWPNRQAAVELQRLIVCELARCWRSGGRERGKRACQRPVPRSAAVHAPLMSRLAAPPAGASHGRHRSRAKRCPE